MKTRSERDARRALIISLLDLGLGVVTLALSLLLTWKAFFT